jgi:methionyl-tRNA formyltransferase
MSDPLRLLFFGTPDFAVPTLEALCERGWAPRLVLSQPARPVGRGRTLTEPPVALRGRELGLRVEQPRRLGEPGLRERLAAERAEVAVVVAYGRLFPVWLLALPERGCLNLHASLLPRWRGAAPIQAAIAAGDAESGVTTMWMEEELDTGPILLQRRVAVGARERAPELAERLARLGAALVVESLERLVAGTVESTPQPSAGVTYAPRVRREDGWIRWELEARRLDALGRAYAGWPGLTASLRGAPLKIALGSALDEVAPPGAEPGEILGLRGSAMAVACGGETVLALERVQRPGRREVPAEVLFRGERLVSGERFDPTPAIGGGERA